MYTPPPFIVNYPTISDELADSITKVTNPILFFCMVGAGVAGGASSVFPLAFGVQRAVLITQLESGIPHPIAASLAQRSQWVLGRLTLFGVDWSILLRDIYLAAFESQLATSSNATNATSATNVTNGGISESLVKFVRTNLTALAEGNDDALIETLMQNGNVVDLFDFVGTVILVALVHFVILGLWGVLMLLRATIEAAVTAITAKLKERAEMKLSLGSAGDRVAPNPKAAPPQKPQKSDKKGKKGKKGVDEPHAGLKRTKSCMPPLLHAIAAALPPFGCRNFNASGFRPSRPRLPRRSSKPLRRSFQRRSAPEETRGRRLPSLGCFERRASLTAARSFRLASGEAVPSEATSSQSGR